MTKACPQGHREREARKNPGPARSPCPRGSVAVRSQSGSCPRATRVTVSVGQDQHQARLSSSAQSTAMREWLCQAVLLTDGASCPLGSTSLLLAGRQRSDTAPALPLGSSGHSKCLRWPSAAPPGGSKWHSPWLQEQTDVGVNPALP